jgi:hypothetical protein
MLSLIILGLESVRMDNINVYMAPSIEELQELWRGVITWEVAKDERQK